MMCGNAWEKFNDPWKCNGRASDKLPCKVSDSKQEPRRDKPEVAKQQQAQFDF